MNALPPRLRVLGASAVRPNPRDACSGYLLSWGVQHLLLDCGPGTTAPLLERIAPEELDAVILSHAHPDHCLGLVMLRQTIAHAPGGQRQEPLPVWLAPAVLPQIEALGEVFAADGEDFWAPHLQLRQLDPEVGLRLPGATLRFAPTKHALPCWAVRVDLDAGSPDAASGWPACSLCYTADTGPRAPGLVSLARSVDLLLAEATYPPGQGGGPDGIHMGAEEAGRLAAEAGARRLVITHTFDAYDRAAMVERAAEACPGCAVALGRAGDVWRL